VKKTSIYLEPELDRALSRRAEATGVTKAELIRETLRRSVSTGRPRITAIGVIEGPGDVADNVDAYLAEGFGRD
jgi:predicted DNA-binding protein